MYSFEKRCWPPTANIFLWNHSGNLQRAGVLQSFCHKAAPLQCVFHCHTHKHVQQLLLFYVCAILIITTTLKWLSDILAGATQLPESKERKLLRKLRKYSQQSHWILYTIMVNLAPLTWSSPSSNVLRNMEPPEESINPGGGEINKNTI